MTIIIYGVAIFLLVAFNIWQRVSVKYAAKRNMFAQILWLGLSVLMGILTFMNAHNIETRMGGIFIVAFFVTLLLWHPGLSQWGVLTSVRQIQAYQTFTKFETEAIEDNLTAVKLFSGDVLLSNLKIKGSKSEIDRFLHKVVKARKF